jgi:hypothetical protein
MNSMRIRAKEHFPMVLLTLLSIVQALALELLWSHVLHAGYLFEGGWQAALAWLQLSAAFLGLMLIWVFYASNAMRFRWVPGTSDSVYPFLIGLLEFMMIETLGPDRVGLWLALMAVIFASMVWIAHSTMRRARADSDNQAFFKDSVPAKLVDFYPHIIAVSVIMSAGLYVHFSASIGIIATFSTIFVLAILTWQFRVVARLWERTVGDSIED